MMGGERGVKEELGGDKGENRKSGEGGMEDKLMQNRLRGSRIMKEMSELERRLKIREKEETRRNVVIREVDRRGRRKKEGSRENIRSGGSEGGGREEKEDRRR